MSYGSAARAPRELTTISRILTRAGGDRARSARGRGSGRSLTFSTGARIGADCNICDHTFIEGGAESGTA